MEFEEGNLIYGVSLLERTNAYYFKLAVKLRNHPVYLRSAANGNIPELTNFTAFEANLADTGTFTGNSDNTDDLYKGLLS